MIYWWPFVFHLNLDTPLRFKPGSLIGGNTEIGFK